MKRFFAVLLAVSLLPLFSFSSLAGTVASSSSAKKNLASSSNAIHFQDSLFPFQVNDNVMLMSSDDLEYGPGKDWWYTAWYSDGSGNLLPRYLEQQSDGSYSASAPGTYDFGEFRITINKAALPSSGSYGFSLTLNHGHVDYNVSACQVQFDMGKDNVRPAYLRSDVETWSNTGSSYTVTANVDIPSNIYSISFIFYLSTFDHSVSLGSSDWAFTLYSNSGSSLVPDINNNTQDDIASGVDNIASGVDSMQGTLEEIVQTISLQLEALWNQLYNYMHVPQLANDDKNTGLITDSIDTMGSDVVDSVDSAASDITSNADSNAQAIQDNADQNTETITNGYDNSGITSDNDRLSGKLDEYGEKEDELLQDVSDGLGGIDFDVDFDSILAPIQLVSNFFQDIYDASGGFKVVINCALLLSFASCAVGLYRLKGGG